MKKLVLFLPVLFLLSCNQTEEPKVVTVTKDSMEKIVEASNLKKAEAPMREVLLQQIATMEKELYASETLDKEKAKKIVTLYSQYYQFYHKYPETPDFLFKAGEITENINEPYRSIDFYFRCYDEYPQFKYAGEALFRLANLYDYKLKNYIKAKELYEEVKIQYPGTQMAKDADAAMQLMGKSDQQLIREFEKKNSVKK
jgi:tetratricopeptide (TPR) repeat protein